jgi:hypothetical protein
VAVFQTVWASFTLWRTRGNQIELYGYAAFGLTVAPYLVMSRVNSISIVLTPDYSAVYLVRTDIMEEAKRHQGHFDGVVGQIPCATDAYRNGHFDGVFDIQDERTFMHINMEHTPPTADQPIDNTHQVEAIEVDISATARLPLRYQEAPSEPAVIIPSCFVKKRDPGIRYIIDLTWIACSSVF